MDACVSDVESSPLHALIDRSIGSRLGPYETLSLIGAGGMGEVYRARDTKLGRDVAIKVLPEAFARDAERMARFQREAKVLAFLNHPNIATIYGLEDSGSTRALVMELVEGPALADRIKAGPIPIDEAVPIARQIADALEYAHERGIIHRDLKRANIKVAADDAVKVLDFGLAKALEGDPSSIDMSTSPTVSRMATQQGVLLAQLFTCRPSRPKRSPWTVGQTSGRSAACCTKCSRQADLHRRDGDRHARGDHQGRTQLVAASRRDAPHVRVLLRRCVQKDTRQRLQAIGDARIALERF